MVKHEALDGMTLVLKVNAGESKQNETQMPTANVWDTLVKVLGVAFSLYGFLAVISPDRYAIANLPINLVPLAGILLLVAGLLILRSKHVF